MILQSANCSSHHSRLANNLLQQGSHILLKLPATVARRVDVDGGEQLEATRRQARAEYFLEALEVD